MVVFSMMNSKRSRRPNVRLWEIGDLSAAFACSISQRNKGEVLEQNQMRSDPYFVQESGYLQSYGREKKSDDYCVSPKIQDDIQQNRENKDPNSSKSVSRLSHSKVYSGTVTRKSRHIRRRRRGPNTLLCCPLISNASFEMHQDNCFENSSEDKTTSTMKEGSEVKIDGDVLSVDTPPPHAHHPNEFGSDGASYEENTAFIRHVNGVNKTSVACDSDENGVKDWLQEIGFGNLAHMFEMHEVDRDALLLLTLEDLKEMGVVAIGPQRKLFTAIQQLKRR